MLHTDTAAAVASAAATPRHAATLLRAISSTPSYVALPPMNPLACTNTHRAWQARRTHQTTEDLIESAVKLVLVSAQQVA
jgi:hypothetical protein